MKTKRLARGFLALCIAFVSLVSSVPVSLAAGLDTGEVIQEVTSSDGFEVADGVTYEEAMFTTSDGRTVAGFMIDTNYGAEGSDLKFGVGTPYDGEEYGMQPVSQQLRYAAMGGRNVLAGVNADFYNMSTGEPEGLLVKDGKEIHAWYPSQEISSRLPYRTFFGILEDGTAVIGYKDDYDRCKDQLVQAVGGDIVMVENGEVIDFSASGIPDNPYTSYPRMCVGIREDGSVFFIAVDGKRPDTYSAGLNLVEMAQLMVENGAETAMNLDGGGSVTMVVKDPDTEDYTLMNSPSDNTSGPTGGTERSIANCLYLYNDDVPSLPQVTLEKDEDGYYLIRGIEDFEQMNYNPGANFRLADDIDGAGTPIEPVSTFAGTLDGAGHTVNNLTFADPGAAGLIEMLGSRGVVEDLTITNAVISSTSSNVGILVGECAGSVRNVNVSGTVTGGNYVGGLIGTISGSRVTVENCHVNADVTASESYVGIFAGQINQNTAGEISRCSAQGTADGSRGVGGFVGYIVDSGSMWIRDCMVTDAFVHGENEHVGGMFGMSKCGVERCFVKEDRKSVV